MSQMTRTSSVLLMAVLFANSGTVLCQDAAAPESAIATFNLLQTRPNIGRWKTIKPDGAAFIESRNPDADGIPLVTEGLFLAFTRDSASQAASRGMNTLVRIQVVEVEEDGWNVRLSPEAAKVLKAGTPVSIIRPVGSTTALMKQMPGLAPVEQVAVSPSPASNRSRSKNNLRNLALAFHNFHDVYGQFPPALINGPDGTPWHSWRVLLLPYFDQAELYNAYRFDEPWNGPHNRQLIDRMPAIFRDPLHGDGEGHFTHYAVAVGPNTVFSPDGGTMEGQRSLGKVSGGRRIRDIIDGTSNTILVGSVSPDRKIPWMKPEDIPFDDSFTGIGSKGGFSAPLEADNDSAGLFALCDGSFLAISSRIDRALLSKLITANDGQIVDRGAIPRIGVDSMRPGPPRVQLHIVETDDGVVARIMRENRTGQ